MLSETETIRLNEILNEFDFEKVHKCMILMNWGWANSNLQYYIPNLNQIKQSAERLLTDVIVSYLRNKISGHIGSGGFEVNYYADCDTLMLKFVVTEWEDSYIKDEPKYKTAQEREKRKKVIKNLLDGENN